jgi:hypothetical protein
MSNKTAQYQTVENRPIGCTFCGAQVQGKITPRMNPRTKEVVQECRWVCGRCNNLSKVGNLK